jgi:ubiquinone/menaquinone biosynthesis C-methylase UbiE
MSTATVSIPALGKPADPGHLILARRRRLVLQTVSLAGKLLLDFGCGNGAQTIGFSGDHCRTIGVDVQDEQLALFRHALSPLASPSILPVRYDGLHLPLRDSSVDVVVSFEVLEHVADEAAVLKEILRVLMPGGDLVITVPNRWWIFETHGAHLPILPWNRIPFFSWLPRGFHRRYALARNYSRRAISALLREAGFRVRAARYVTAPMDVVSHPWLQRTLRASLFRGDTTQWGILATSLFIHATKERDS